jgi:hypothetical protein
MNIDDILRTSVDEVARAVTPPAPDPRSVRARARANRRRQWAAAAVGTAAVMVGGVAITSALPNQGSIPPADNLAPSPSTVAELKDSAIWSYGRSLHLGSSELAAPDGIFGFGLVKGGVVYSTNARDAKVFFQPVDGSAATQIGDNAQLAPAGDPTSGLVSWFEAQGNDGSLVVFDTATGQEVARTSVPPVLRPQANIIFPGTSPVISVSSAAVYFYRQDEEVWVYRWAAGEVPESTGKSREELFDVAAGVTAQAGSEAGSVEFVTDQGTVLATGPPPGGYLSPDGSRFASVGGSMFGTGEGSFRPRILVSDTSTGETTELDLFGSGDERGLLFGVGWSGNDTVMVTNILPNGSTVLRGSTVRIAAAASDDRGVTKVEFRVNGTLRCTDTTAPYTCDWKVYNTVGATNWIKATAYDAAGNSSSHSVSTGTL